LRVPVVAVVRQAEKTLYVRLGHQFCVADAEAAVATLGSADFRATLRSPLKAG
jgi:DNA polymerase-3 subunit alpha